MLPRRRKRTWRRLISDLFRFGYRRLRNQPLEFSWVGAEGIAAGEALWVFHLTLHDMMEHQARGMMTNLVLLKGLRANAIQVLDFKQLDDWHGRTLIQPRWIES